MRSPIDGTDGNAEFLALLGDPPGVDERAWLGSVRDVARITMPHE
jgi:hypothetical protein